MNRPDAGTLAGALADPQRRTIFAAVQLGADTFDRVAERTGLAHPAVAKGLGRLVEMGVVVADGGVLAVPVDVFGDAARAARAKPPTDEHADLPDDARKVMNAFVADGRLLSIPTSHTKRLVVLDWLSQGFEPGRRYSEPMVNLLLGQRHADTAALRRHLVDEGFLDRDAGEYWRSGGSTAP